MELLRKTTFCLAIILLCACNSWGASAIVKIREPQLIPATPALSLADCINLALKNQPSIRTAQAQAYGQAGAVLQSQAGLLPGISASASTEVAGDQPGGPVQITFSGNQLIYDFGGTAAKVAGARHTESSDILNESAVAANVVLSVKQAYYTFLEDTHLVDVYKENLADQQAHVAETQAQEAAGTAPHTNVLTAQAAASSAQFDLVTAQNTANIARINLNSAMGVDIRSPIQIAETSEPETPVPTQDDAVNLALTRRPEIRRDVQQVLAARAGVKASSVGDLPTVSGSADYSPNSRTNAFGQSQSSTQTQVLLNLQWSPIDFGATRGAIQQARAQVLTAEETLYSDKETVATQTAQALLNVTAGEAQLASANAEVASAQQNLDAAVGSYQAGIGIFLSVIDAQAALLKAEVDEYTARYGLSIARAQLQQATGEVTP